MLRDTDPPLRRDWKPPPFSPASLYDILGVKYTATPREITAAYRRLAQKHHPDKGGDQDTFAEINLAYRVLHDPMRRYAYDTTGTTPEGSELDDPDMAVWASINDLMARYLHNAEIDQVDLMEYLRVNLTDRIDMAKHALAHGQRLLGMAERIKARIRKSGSVPDGEDRLLALIEANRREIERAQETLKGTIRHAERAICLLGVYTYQPKPEVADVA